MTPSLPEQAEQFMRDAWTRANMVGEISHHQRTAHWIKTLRPDAGDALLVAGLLHDIERAFHGDWKAGSLDPVQIQKHQRLCADMAERFLQGAHADAAFTDAVKDLILHHETGGTEDQNLLCDADCLAYFEEKAVDRARRAQQEGRSEQYREKLDGVYRRMHSPQAKAIATPWYEAALRIVRS
ncbi:DUF4202 family protein [Candidatus Uhrbacteria bacterium]|nr:DUF4202 family protein [Candidatus Uhrbacteria bacterium]